MQEIIISKSGITYVIIISKLGITYVQDGNVIRHIPENVIRHIPELRRREEKNGR